MDKKMVPEVRFKGFTDDWEQLPLKDIVNITMGQSPKSTNYTTNPNDYILVQGNTDIFNGWVRPRIWTKQITKLAKKGDTILSVRAPVGDVSKTGYDIVIGRGVAAISKDEYVFQFLQKAKMNGFWNKITTGSTFESINSSDIQNLTIPISVTQEQKRISDILKVIDDLDLLQQRQLDLYKKLRKGLLQKLFPIDGEKVPEVRFADFTGDWKQYKLKTVTKEISDKSSKGELLSVTITDGIVKNSTLERKNNSSKDKSKYKKVEIGDIAYNSMRMWQGASGVAKYSGIVSPAYTVFKVKKNVLNNIFLGYLIKIPEMTWKFRISSQGLTSDTWNLKYPSFSKINIQIPSLKEQIYLADLLENIDKMLFSQEKQLKTLKSLKKYLLQKLFI